MPPRVREPTGAAEHDQAIDVLCELWTDEPRDRVAEFFEEAGYHALCAFEDEDVVGVAGVSEQRALHHERHAWVHDIVVTAERRGEGIGRVLMGAVESWARERGLDLVALATIDSNDDARRFYDENGYEEWGRVHERRL